MKSKTLKKNKSGMKNKLDNCACSCHLHKKGICCSCSCDFEKLVQNPPNCVTLE